MNINKSPRRTGQIFHRLFRDVSRMVVQNNTNGGSCRIIISYFLQQRYKLRASMPIMNLGNDMTAMQIQGSQDRQGPQPFVFIIPHNPGLFLWIWQDIGCNILDGLDPRFFVHDDRNDRRNLPGSKGFVLKVHFLVYTQHLFHFMVKVWITPLQIIGPLMRAYRMLTEDSLYGGFTRFLQTLMARFGSIFLGVLRQSLTSPYFSSIAKILRFLASNANDPGFRLFCNHWLFRPMIFVLKAFLNPHGQGFLHPFVNRRPTHVSHLFNLGNGHAF